MPQITIDKQSANRLVEKGWTMIEHQNAYKLWPPGMEIPKRYLPDESKKESKELSKADMIRELLKGGKSKQQTIAEMLKRFPKGSKSGIISQVYMTAKKM